LIAALFVETDGCYFGLPGVDPWDKERDARLYAGPWPVVAHPPCERWGRFWHGSTRKPHQFQLGDDGDCFRLALMAVRRYGGVLEHPADSHAWSRFGINRPPRSGGWIAAGTGRNEWTCYVEQGWYGHQISRKPTWLYCAGMFPPSLRWGRGEQRLHPIALEKYGYAKARRIGMMAMIGGKDKTKIRNATPIEFRDLLISIAECGGVGAKHGNARTTYSGIERADETPERTTLRRSTDANYDRASHQ
jgi:hypothetical protein